MIKQFLHVEICYIGTDQEGITRQQSLHKMCICIMHELKLGAWKWNPALKAQKSSVRGALAQLESLLVDSG